MIKAVLWDVDGVLIDTAPFHYQAWRTLFASLGKELSRAEFLKTFGLRNDDTLQSILGPLPDDRLQELGHRKEEIFREAIRGHIAPMPGAVEIVRRLRRAGVRQAVVSSAPRDNVVETLRALSIEGEFQELITEEDVGRGKPDPQGYVLAAERLGVPPSDCVVIEDAPAGVEAAKRAGARCIGLAAGRAPEELAQADLVVGSLEDEAVNSFLGISRQGG